MADESKFARKEIAKGNELLVLGNDGIGALLPRQANVRAETIFRTGTLVAGLHDAAARTGNDHESGRSHLLAKLQRLLIFRLARLRACGTKNGDLALLVIRREESKSVAQFTNRRLNDAHIARICHVCKQLKCVLDNVGNLGFVCTATFGLNEFRNL